MLQSKSAVTKEMQAGELFCYHEQQNIKLFKHEYDVAKVFSSRNQLFFSIKIIRQKQGKTHNTCGHPNP